MTLWLVRAGKHGEPESLDFDKGLAAIEWDVGDLLIIKSRNELQKALEDACPDEKKKTLLTWERADLPLKRIWLNRIRRPALTRPANVSGYSSLQLSCQFYEPPHDLVSIWSS
jgi:hypothetical protein